MIFLSDYDNTKEPGLRLFIFRIKSYTVERITDSRKIKLVY